MRHQFGELRPGELLPFAYHGGQIMVIPQLLEASLHWELLHGLCTSQRQRGQLHQVVQTTLCCRERSLHFPKDMPIAAAAETYGGIEVCAIRKQHSLLMFYDSTMEHESQNYGGRFGTLLTSTDYSKADVWWGRLAYQGEAGRVFSAYYESLTGSEQTNYFPEFAMNYARYGRAAESGGPQYLLRLGRGRQAPQARPRLDPGRALRPWKVTASVSLRLQPLHRAGNQRTIRRPIMPSVPASFWHSRHPRPLHAPHA